MLRTIQCRQQFNVVLDSKETGDEEYCNKSTQWLAFHLCFEAGITKTALLAAASVQHQCDGMTGAAARCESRESNNSNIVWTNDGQNKIGMM